MSENGTLPEDSLVAGGLIGVVLDNHIETKNRLFEKFEKELSDRARSEKGDVEALKILVLLSAAHPDQADRFRSLWLGPLCRAPVRGRPVDFFGRATS